MSPTLALLLAVFGALMLVAVLLDDMAARLRVPGVLLVLVLGLLTDNDLDAITGLEAQPLLTLASADQIAQVALVLVLFFGGLTTNWRELRAVLQPAARLASLGSLVTALLITGVVMALGSLASDESPMSFPLALFVGAMVCSTDASAVLALLRPLSGRLPKRLIDLIECESAFNDPVAVVLAGVAMAMAGAGGASGLATPSSLVTEVMRQFLLGILLGFLGGSLARQLLAARRSLTSPALLAVVSLAVLMLLVGGTQLLGGSGLLAAYIAGLVLGNSADSERLVLEEAHAGFAKMAELLLFLCMGLVVSADAVVESSLHVLVLFGSMLLARWLMVELVLARSGFPRNSRLFISFSGLRGAVPIALAIQAAASSVPWGDAMPPLALGVVLLGLLGQGFLLVPLAQRLGLATAAEPPQT
ncbi:cation:proton antiporter [Synechococcus sp. CCY9201]|uniref:cation:proton antiporter domain-containing protein n=1 Tax=unclassified Synechococcus TaxID=2626047 RepID=UPI0018CD1F80|nr:MULTISPECIES: cation:proton antiporter [unclassified Synechococcus]MEA5475715.1 cation:proton antiporter [Synechococcus sp. CCY9201]QPN60327.1 cation:proton antiporter [Synechococcus sp. CBW1002]QPN67957.1 cation:proton antiporter [Synechococcus sp. CBW1006]